jgi:hypothetical protein
VILPIMTVEQVRDWKGTRYDAIVLAGDWTDKNNSFIEAAEIYKVIRATDGMLNGAGEIRLHLLANEAEREMARATLEEMILSVTRSFLEKTNDLDETLAYLEKVDTVNRRTITENCDGIEQALAKLQQSGQVLVPRNPTPTDPSSTSTITDLKVRKISFSAATDINNNPAPDPILLLAKAVSNMLKRQELKLLPDCGDGSTCSDSVISHRAEAIMRGWSTNDVSKESRLSKVVDVSETITYLSDLDNDDAD